MYSTCLHCNKDLGMNAVLETLPIGRRVAFDAAQGRLWVVCGSCAKWNLVPFDTRLETIDACEQIFRDTRTRFSTDNIGLARLREGLELVRVGAALRPEFAAWRYGAGFGSRRRRNLARKAGAGVSRGVVFAALQGLGGLGVVGQLIWTAAGFPALDDEWRKRSVALLLSRPDGEAPVVITRADLADIRIAAYHDGWDLAVTDRRVRPGLSVVAGGVLPDLILQGPEAITTLGRVLPSMSGVAGSRTEIRDAVEVVEASKHANAIIEKHFRFQRHAFARAHTVALSGAAPSLRLALEMAAHEESEREALRGELKLLEREWRKAEELAKIADSLAIEPN